MTDHAPSRWYTVGTGNVDVVLPGEGVRLLKCALDAREKFEQYVRNRLGPLRIAEGVSSEDKIVFAYRLYNVTVGFMPRVNSTCRPGRSRLNIEI